MRLKCDHWTSPTAKPFTIYIRRLKLNPSKYLNDSLESYPDLGFSFTIRTNYVLGWCIHTTGRCFRCKRGLNTVGKGKYPIFLIVPITAPLFTIFFPSSVEQIWHPFGSSINRESDRTRLFAICCNSPAKWCIPKSVHKIRLSKSFRNDTRHITTNCNNERMQWQIEWSCKWSSRRQWQYERH